MTQESSCDTIAAAQLICKNEKDFRTLAEYGRKILVLELFHEQLPSCTETVGDPDLKKKLAAGG